MLCNIGSMGTHTHLFISCPYVRNIWFFLGMGQDLQCQWHKMTDIFDFALSFQHVQQNAFYSVCWSVWKLRNDMCFRNGQLSTVRNIVMLIWSLMSYWAGLNFKHRGEDKACARLDAYKHGWNTSPKCASYQYTNAYWHNGTRSDYWHCVGR